MRTTHPRDWREGRRLRAWALHQQGWKQNRIAEGLGVTPGAVSQWLKRARDGGVEALRTRFSPGAPTRLSRDQRAELPALLARGAPAFGFLGDIWTRARVAEVIKREFGVTYHRDHIGRLLKAIGWTVQKPIKRATQRDEQEIAAWRDWHATSSFTTTTARIRVCSTAPQPRCISLESIRCVYVAATGTPGLLA